MATISTADIFAELRRLGDKSNAYDNLVEALSEQSAHFQAMSLSYYESAAQYKASDNVTMYEWSLGKGQAYGLAASAIDNHVKQNQVQA
jgi:hypothetical protein